MNTRIFLLGLLIWVIGTIGVRFSGHHLLRTNSTSYTLILYAVSFVLMALLVRRICLRASPDRDRWPQLATLLILPTLLLDPLSCIFFPTVFPNLDPGAAGIFGGWMLICCGGGVAGIWIRR
jgi:hypothetical protein